MSMDACIIKALEAGAMTQAQADALRADAAAAIGALRQKGIHSEEQAKALGELEALEHRRAVEKRNKYQKVLQAQANKRNLDILNSHPDGMAKGLVSLLVRDLKNHKGHTPWSNIDYRSKAIEAQAHSLAADLLANLHTTHLGLKQDAGTLRDVVRAAFGEDVANPKAKAAAKAWAEASEFLRQRYNRAGGFIPKRDDWGLPQGHDSKLVAKAGRDAWIESIMPKLKRDAMLNLDGRVMTDSELTMALREVYTTVATDGMNKRTAGAFGGGKLANRHQDSRFLVFKDADSWLEYQAEFGEPEVFNVLTGHMRHMSSEIAQLEVLGPNPAQAYKMLTDTLDINGVEYNSGLVDAYYSVVSGEADAIAHNRSNVAKRASAVRHIMIAAQLGSAAISAITDPVFGAFTRKFNGIPLNKMVNRTIGQLNPADPKDRAFAAHMGMVMDGWCQQALSGARFGGDADPAGAASKVSEVVFRASGLTAWTAGQRQAFALDFMWHLQNEVGKPLSAVESKFQDMIRRYGITDDEWAIMQNSKPESHGGASYFRPQNIYDTGIPKHQADTIVTKLNEAIQTEMDFATPTPDARVRAITTWGGKQRGTVAGEMARFAMMYKSFSITQFSTHMMRGNITYPIYMALALTAMGSFSLQLKEIAKGREPQEMDNVSFWTAAMFQGGGLGIIGDFFTTATGANRYGNSFLATAAGPAGSMIEDVYDLAMSAGGAGVNVFTGEESDFGGELVEFMKRYTPASSLWYGRLILERALWDNLELLADPDAQGNWDKYAQKLQTERDQEYWWGKGEAIPSF